MSILQRAEALAACGLTRENIYISLLADVRALGLEVPPQAEISAAIARGHSQQAPREAAARSNRAPITRQRARDLKARPHLADLPPSNPVRLLRLDEDTIFPVLVIRSNAASVRVLGPSGSQTNVPKTLLIRPKDERTAWRIFKEMRQNNPNSV